VSEEKELVFYVNGEERRVRVYPDETLLHVLRERLRLTGTKAGCEEGECGACTVLVEGTPVNSCLLPALRFQSQHVETVEGLDRGGRLHPLQDAFIEAGAVQCGFCTPGMLMSAKALLEKNPSPSREDIAQALSGNLCRCTGYVKIADAVALAAKTMRNTGGK
jgi:aerobic-type carbon monoxide dehydrogenase small subunit (CoxS/CutS family)